LSYYVGQRVTRYCDTCGKKTRRKVQSTGGPVLSCICPECKKSPEADED